MREEEANWTARWEEELPSPDELTPLSQTLITPDLALAFNIPTTTAAANPNLSDPAPPPPSSAAAHHNNHLHHPPPSDFDSGDMGGGNGGDEPARTLKRPRLVWTPQLHKRFVDAVAHLGIKNAVPKTIMQLMSVDGLTRENVASHLQKYRLYLKRMQGLGPSSGAGSGNISAADDRLFSTVPVPFPPPYVPVPTLQQHQQMAAAAQYYHQRQLGHYGSTAGHGFLARANPPQQPGLHLNPMAGLAGLGLMPPQPAAVADMETDSDREGGGGRKVLTLFPTGED